MLNNLFDQIKTSLQVLLFFTLLLGLIYPLFITGIAQLCFPWQANGSLIMQNNKKIGSALIGQFNESPEYFWGRPSATQPFPYNSAESSGSNLGPSNPKLLNVVQQRITSLSAHHNHRLPIPVNLVTTSGSGLDPEISPAAAFYQVTRIAQARHISEADLKELIRQHIQNRTFGLLGEKRVNVLQLNLALDHIKGTP